MVLAVFLLCASFSLVLLLLLLQGTLLLLVFFFHCLRRLVLFFRGFRGRLIVQSHCFFFAVFFFIATLIVAHCACTAGFFILSLGVSGTFALVLACLAPSPN